jgi:hypothetical protein
MGASSFLTFQVACCLFAPKIPAATFGGGRSNSNLGKASPTQLWLDKTKDLSAQKLGMGSFSKNEREIRTSDPNNHFDFKSSAQFGSRLRTVKGGRD